MASPPKTILKATPEEEAAIRAAVRDADPATLGPARVVAGESHVAGVLDLLADPAVSDPIYDLPRPFTADAVRAWIAECEALRRRGEGVLILTVGPGGVVFGYSK